METKIVPNRGHYDVYINGDLYCSADTWQEAEKEIKEGSKANEQNYDLKL